MHPRCSQRNLSGLCPVTSLPEQGAQASPRQPPTLDLHHTSPAPPPTRTGHPLSTLPPWSPSSFPVPPERRAYEFRKDCNNCDSFLGQGPRAPPEASLYTHSSRDPAGLLSNRRGHVSPSSVLPQLLTPVAYGGSGWDVGKPPTVRVWTCTLRRARLSGTRAGLRTRLSLTCVST